MATIIGESGVYRGVLDSLSTLKLSIRDLDEIHALKRTLTEQRAGIEAIAAFEHLTKEQELIDDLEKAERELAVALADGTARFERNLENAANRLVEAGRVAAACGSFLRNLLRPVRLPRWWSTRRAVSIARSSHYQALLAKERFLHAALAKVTPKRRVLEEHRRGREAFITVRLNWADAQLGGVTRLIERGDVAGAAGELKVIDTLRTLSDQWFILNDVTLRAHRWIRFEGKALNSAQVDHVVVGPGGVFVIETKYWSRKFAESGAYHDPFEQVSRASYLCHRLLRDGGFPAKTRAIIAAGGELPHPREDSFTKVLRPREVCGYVTWFRRQLSEAEVKAIVTYLSSFAHAIGS